MRFVGLDALRVVGVAAVVLAHVYTGPFSHQWIYPWHVPLFFFLTGYFWSSGRRLGEEVSRRARTLLVPYATWLVVNLLVVSIITGPSISLLISAAWGGSRATGPFGAFWFVTTLFFTSLLYRALERFPVVVPAAVAAIGLVLCAALPGRLDDVPLGIGMSLPCLAFVLAGRLARRVTPSGRAGVRIGTGLVLGGLVSCALLPVGDIDLKSASVGTPVIGVAVSVAICWGLVAIFRELSPPPIVGRVVGSLAAVAVTVVLTHTAVIWALRLEDTPPLVIAVAALVGSWTIALVLHRLPGSRLTIGAPRAVRSGSAPPPAR